MSWVASSRIGARRLIAIALLATAGAAAADILVVRSTGPSAKSFPPGKRLAPTARISLRANDQLIVLDGRGTRAIRGPGTFTAGAAQGRSASAAPATTSRARIGAVRGPGTGTIRPPSIWHVDVSRSSAFCVAEPGKLTLWRADTTGAATATITRTSDGATRRLSWQGGESTAAWPADLPIADGAQYRLSLGGSGAPTLLSFRTLSSRPAGLEDMASSLIRNDCTAQLDLLIDTVRLPETGTGN